MDQCVDPTPLMGSLIARCNKSKGTLSVVEELSIQFFCGTVGTERRVSICCASFGARAELRSATAEAIGLGAKPRDTNRGYSARCVRNEDPNIPY